MKYLLLTLTIATIIACKPNAQTNTNTTTEIASEVTSAELHQMLADHQDITILDVRTPEEISNGKLDGAIEINFYDEDFDKQISSLDKSKHYVVYCKAGGRSAKAISKMKAQGFEKCTNLQGGYTAWSKSNK